LTLRLQERSKRRRFCGERNRDLFRTGVVFNDGYFIFYYTRSWQCAARFLYIVMFARIAFDLVDGSFPAFHLLSCSRDSCDPFKSPFHFRPSLSQWPQPHCFSPPGRQGTFYRIHHHRQRIRIVSASARYRVDQGKATLLQPSRSSYSPNDPWRRSNQSLQASVALFPDRRCR
jgi:hypothetical protein